MGVEFSLLNKVNGCVDYYNGKRKDLVRDVGLGGYRGFDKIGSNLGSVGNCGFEGEVGGNMINKGGLSWDMRGKVCSVGNKIIKLGENKEVNKGVGGGVGGGEGCGRRLGLGK